MRYELVEGDENDNLFSKGSKNKSYLYSVQRVDASVHNVLCEFIYLQVVKIC